MSGRSDRADEAPTVVWPAPARSRYVSEETVNAVMCLITGDWGDGHRGGAEEIVLVIPEGLILLFGLLSTTSVRPSVRCSCLTQVGMWIKTSSENARAVLNCPNWQRWFVGMQSASMRLFNRGNAGPSQSFQWGHSVEDSEAFASEEDSELHFHEHHSRNFAKRSPQSSMDIQLEDTASSAGGSVESEVASLRPAITALVVDCLSSLYSYLLTDVKRGYAHWGIFLTHVLKIPGGAYLTRAVVVATLRRVMRHIKTEPLTPVSQVSGTAEAPKRRNSKAHLVSMPKHIADNLGATFQLVDEMLSKRQSSLTRAKMASIGRLSSYLHRLRCIFPRKWTVLTIR